MDARSGHGKKALRDLDLYLLNTKNPQPHEVELVEKCFALWRDSWEETFRQLKVIGHDGHIYSDDFLEREAIALFDRERPVGLVFDHLACARESHLSHSYFKNYPPEVFHSLAEMGYSRFMIFTYISVHPDYRKSKTDIPMYELLFSLGIKKLRTLPNYHCLLGYIRKDLSFHSTYLRHGGIFLAKKHVYNVDVDYFYISKNSMRLSPDPAVAFTADMLWEKMLFRERAALARAGKMAA